MSFPDPSGKDRVAWREVRGALGDTARRLVETLARGDAPADDDLDAGTSRTTAR